MRVANLRAAFLYERAALESGTLGPVWQVCRETQLRDTRSCAFMRVLLQEGIVKFIRPCYRKA